MSKQKKFLDYEGVKHLWSKINMQDYPNNDMLMTIISAIDETKADKEDIKSAIRYEEQTLTDEQKAQARKNIGADGYDWHYYKVFGRSDRYISNIENNPGITDWDAFESLTYSGTNSNYHGYASHEILINHLQMIFEITWSSTSYENRIVSYGSVLSEVYFSLRNAGALSTSGSDIVFAIKNGYLPGYGRPIHYRLVDNSSRGILTIFRDIGNDIEDQIQFDYVNSAIYKMSVARYGSDVVYKHRPVDEVGKVLMVGDNRQVIAADLPVQTQPDWSRNDESALDFVKNRTHYEENNQIVVKWDGNIEGRDSFTMPLDFDVPFYKISDLIPSYDELVGAELSFWGGETGEILEEYLLEGQGCTNFEGYILVVARELNCSYLLNGEEISFTVPSTGIYSIYADFDGDDIPDYVSGLSYGSSTVHQLDEKFIPNTIARISDIPGVTEQVQSDWTQTDESAPDFIKNKPDEEDALALLVEVGFIEPAVAADGSIYTDENGKIYTLI